MMGLFKSVCAKIAFLLAVATGGTVSAAAMPAGSHAWMVFFGIPTQYNGYMASAPARVPEPTTGVLLLAGLSLAVFT